MPTMVTSTCSYYYSCRTRTHLEHVWWDVPTVFIQLYCTSNRTLFISRSCLILVLAVLGRPRHTDAKNIVKNYQGQLLPEKMRFENTK
jgi:hypothetical protein